MATDSKNTYLFRLIGNRPLLTHNPSGMTGGSGKDMKTKQIPMPKDEAAAGLYLNADGRYSFPAIGIRRCLITAASKSRMKIGKYSAADTISANVFPVEELCLIEDAKTSKPIKTYEVNVQRAVVVRQGILRARPLFRDWAIRIALEIDETYITAEHVLTVMNLGGKMVGIGDYRPERKGMYGQFTAELIK